MKVFPTHIVAAGGIVENEDGNILLVKTYSGGWVPPGGQVEVGENIIDALIREIREESGINVVVDKLFFVGSNTSTYDGYNGYGTIPTKVVLNFICTPVDGDLRGSEENYESRWVPRVKALDMITDPSIRDRFQAYLGFDGNVQYMEYVSKPEYKLKLKRQI